MVGLEKFRAFVPKFRTCPSSNRSELFYVSSAPEMSETEPSLFFEPVSC